MDSCVEPGEYVVREGEPGDGVYFILDGEVCLNIHVVDLRETKTDSQVSIFTISYANLQKQMTKWKQGGNFVITSKNSKL